MNSNIIKVLIVDDERLVRNLLIKRIAWNDLGMEIVGEASSGEEAVELVDKYNPHVVFTDICMANMDGIQFADYIINKYPNMKVVVISGYDDFNYAQRGIKAGIKDYILKPIDDEVVKNTALKLKKEIEEERLAVTEYASIKKQLVESRPVFLERFLGRLAQSDIDKEALNPQKVKRLNKVIDDISKYMRENLGDSELSLTKISQVFFLNPSYLSRVFKKETGINFMDYLTKLRIEEAMILLKNTDLMAYEIGAKVGIPDSSYFSTCFKKYTGLSVSEYKKK